MSVTGTNEGDTVTITDINSSSVTLRAPEANNAAKKWNFKKVEVSGAESDITLTDTTDENVKKFNMIQINGGHG